MGFTGLCDITINIFYLHEKGILQKLGHFFSPQNLYFVISLIRIWLLITKIAFYSCCHLWSNSIWKVPEKC